MDGHGNIKMALSGVDVPQKINTGSVETCSGCGKITIAGIFDVKEQQIIFNAGEESQDYEEDEASDYYGEDTTVPMNPKRFSNSFIFHSLVSSP